LRTIADLGGSEAMTQVSEALLIFRQLDGEGLDMLSEVSPHSRRQAEHRGYQHLWSDHLSGRSISATPPNQLGSHATCCFFY
jgi:hypothetical protein